MCCGTVTFTVVGVMCCGTVTFTVIAVMGCGTVTFTVKGPMASYTPYPETPSDCNLLQIRKRYYIAIYFKFCVSQRKR
jgi:hypothetical protein